MSLWGVLSGGQMQGGANNSVQQALNQMNAQMQGMQAYMPPPDWNEMVPDDECEWSHFHLKRPPHRLEFLQRCLFS